MNRDRIVVETTRQEKLALSDALEKEGIGVSEWFHEQLDLKLSLSSPVPAHEEIESLEVLREPKGVLRDLKSLDWSFTDDDTSYLSHDVHPYPAKFIPQIPGQLVSRLSLRGDLVLDPFAGSGTTALEALRLGRRALLVDANPIGILICRVKTARPTTRTLGELGRLTDSVRTKHRSLQHDSIDLNAKYEHFIPQIPNIEKWFPPSSCGELALIRFHISALSDPIASDIANLALSRVVLKVSFQDSETRYASRPREVATGTTLLRFLRDIDVILTRVLRTAPEVQFGVVQCIRADARTVGSEIIKDSSVDLVVTSPPYGNANDYHLYHRFRLFWLGWDPKQFGEIEIGSHLRHQREGTGLDAYLDDMRPCVKLIHRVLRPARYCAMVIGDSIYKGKCHDTARLISKMASDVGLEPVGVVERPIHRTKRSFVAAGRRATHESILLLRKPPQRCMVTVELPNYRLWPYEKKLALEEIKAVLALHPKLKERPIRFSCDPFIAPLARRLTFAKALTFNGTHQEKTWQAILENGFSQNEGSRKDPKYATHGLHPYKGKFYPQLAKALLNITGIAAGGKVLDPFCGSGTTLLECQLNGMRAYGCDLHPLAAKIARTKVGILDVNPREVLDAVALTDKLLANPPKHGSGQTEQFTPDALDEISRWFAPLVATKLNWVLRAIRESSEGMIREFLEVVLSGCIREVSQQDPTDLRIRKRKEPLNDADLFSIFRQSLAVQVRRLERFWSIKGYCPYRLHSAQVVQGDAREFSLFNSLCLSKNEVDLVLTSPPYATALPYIDTDRLSLLVLYGMTSRERRPLEELMTGSREISLSERRRLEGQITKTDENSLPKEIRNFVQELYEANRTGKMGFRRQNMPSLLLRFFRDMHAVLANCKQLLRLGGEAIIVIGDSTTNVNGKIKRIPTTDYVQLIGESLGMRCEDKLDITVTRENLRHIHHSITQNTVLRLRKS